MFELHFSNDILFFMSKNISWKFSITQITQIYFTKVILKWLKLHTRLFALLTSIVVQSDANKFILTLYIIFFFIFFLFAYRFFFSLFKIHMKCIFIVVSGWNECINYFLVLPHTHDETLFSWNKRALKNFTLFLYFWCVYVHIWVELKFIVVFGTSLVLFS